MATILEIDHVIYDFDFRCMFDPGGVRLAA